MRPPFFAFYPADFAGDINVEAMSTLAVGAYILLLCKAWQSDPPGSLPNNDQTLARLARLSAVEWAEVSAAVLACFELRPDGRLHQARLRAEYDKAISVMKAKRKGGQKGAEVTNARRGGATGKVSGTPAGTPASDPPGLPRLTRGRLEIGDGEKKEEKTPLPPAEPGGNDATQPLVEFVDINQWPALVAAWTAARLPGAGKIQRTNNRVGLLQQRLADDAWRGRWREAVARAGRSRFCRGEDPKFFARGLQLDTFLRDPDMVARILEGQLDDGGNASPPPPPDPREQQRRHLLAQVKLENMTRQEAETQFGGSLDERDDRPAAA